MDIHRIEIVPSVFDTRTQVRQKKLENIGLKKKIKSLLIADVYSLDRNFSAKELQKIADVLANPLVSKTSIDKAIMPADFSYAIEIGFLPGVTDNIAATAKETVEDSLHFVFKKGEGIYTSQITFIRGQINESEARRIADALYNPLIQRAQIRSSAEYKKNKGMDRIVPRVSLDNHLTADEINLNVVDEELTIIGKQGVANVDGTRRGPLALDLLYMKAIQKYFKKKGRNPTDVELESIAQTWSEHCKHTIFADPIDEIKDGLYKTYIKAATKLIRSRKKKKDFCVSVFTDNSGAIIFDEKYLVTDKVETHNSPSALDPFGGAITGIVGVNRDAIGFGLGAKPVINRYGFCFADPSDDKPLYKGPNKTQKMLSPKRIMQGVIDGVNAGGNCSGIPTPQGFMYFDKSYKGKPLVFVGTVGLIPKTIKGKKMYRKKAQPGDYIVMIGGRVGKDGIHGATFSSEAMDQGSPATAVQIGDPITQKKLSDAIVKEARDLGLFNSITDNGAGGLSCSVAEMAKECGGCRVKLDTVPVKYPGMAPWEIWISESQERMTLAVPKKKWNRFFDLMKQRGVDATVIGEFTKQEKCIVEYKNKIIMDVDMDFLHDGLPSRPMKTSYKTPKNKDPKISEKYSISDAFFKLLESPNITSLEFVSMQYDHEVQAGSVLKPLQGKGRVNADASVTKPLLNSKKAVILSQGLTPRYSLIDTYHMAASSIDTAVRNAVASGANPDHLALLDNFCWCSSTEPERLGQLKRAAQACYDYATTYGMPFISGKDSMFNDFKGYDDAGKPVKISILPTLLISAIGVVNDCTKVVSLDFKSPGDFIYVLGETYDELGASEYYAVCGDGSMGNTVPVVHAKQNIKLYRDLYKCIQHELVSSSISVGAGGLAVALAKSAIGGKYGATLSLAQFEKTIKREDHILFSESQGRIVVSIAPEYKREFEKTMKGNAFYQIGTVSSDNKFIILNSEKKQLVNIKIEKLERFYKSKFKDY